MCTCMLDTWVNVHRIMLESADEGTVLALMSILPSWFWDDPFRSEDLRSRDTDGLEFWPGEGQQVIRASLRITKHCRRSTGRSLQSREGSSLREDFLEEAAFEEWLWR